MDMFLSIEDPNNEKTLQTYYDEVYVFLKDEGYTVGLAVTTNRKVTATASYIKKKY